GSAVTDEQGKFQIEFTESYFKELFFDRKPDLFFKVFRGDVLIGSTEDSVLWNVGAGDSEIAIEVDAGMEQQPKSREDFSDELVIQGHVLQGDSRPLGGIIVRAFDEK